MGAIISFFIAVLCLCQLINMWYITIPVIYLTWLYVKYLK